MKTWVSWTSLRLKKCEVGGITQPTTPHDYEIGDEMREVNEVGLNLRAWSAIKAQRNLSQKYEKFNWALRVHRISTDLCVRVSFASTPPFCAISFLRSDMKFFSIKNMWRHFILKEIPLQHYETGWVVKASEWL